MRASLASIFTIVLMLTVPAASEEFGTGDWKFSIGGDGNYRATTTNGPNNVLGMICVPQEKTCNYFLALGSSCEEGDVHTLLVNSELGALPMDFVCGSSSRSGLSGMSPVKQAHAVFDEVVRKSNRVGFAIAQEDSGIKTVVFSLRGSSAVIDIMRSAAVRDHGE